MTENELHKITHKVSVIVEDFKICLGVKHSPISTYECI